MLDHGTSKLNKVVQRFFSHILISDPLLGDSREFLALIRYTILPAFSGLTTGPPVTHMPRGLVGMSPGGIPSDTHASLNGTSP